MAQSHYKRAYPSQLICPYCGRFMEGTTPADVLARAPIRPIWPRDWLWYCRECDLWWSRYGEPVDLGAKGFPHDDARFG
jgi:hypothetical protein